MNANYVEKCLHRRVIMNPINGESVRVKPFRHPYAPKRKIMKTFKTRENKELT